MDRYCLFAGLYLPKGKYNSYATLEDALKDAMKCKQDRWHIVDLQEYRIVAIDYQYFERSA
jgi:hypothetical protein